MDRVQDYLDERDIKLTKLDNNLTQHSTLSKDMHEQNYNLLKKKYSNNKKMLTLLEKNDAELRKKQEEMEIETEQRTLDRQKRIEIYKKMKQSLKERYNCTNQTETYSDEKPLFDENSPPSDSCCTKFFKYFI